MNTLELVRARLLTLSLAEVQAVAKAVDAPWPTVYKFRNEVTKDPSYTLVERLRIHFGIPADDTLHARPDRKSPSDQEQRILETIDSTTHVLHRALQELNQMRRLKGVA